MFAKIIAVQAFCAFNLGSISVFEKRNHFMSFLDTQEASGTISVDPWLRKGVDEGGHGHAVLHTLDIL